MNTTTTPPKDLERELTTIETLLESPGWQYLVRRLTEERQIIRAQIADDNDLSDNQVRALRMVSAHYERIIQLPIRDRGVLHQQLKNQAAHETALRGWAPSR